MSSFSLHAIKRYWQFVVALKWSETEVMHPTVSIENSFYGLMFIQISVSEYGSDVTGF